MGLESVALISHLSFNPLVIKYKQTAACIQEHFDCTVLSLPWNDVKDSCPDNEDVSMYAKKFKKKEGNFTKLRNWYTPDTLSTLPLSVARVICQRTNCWWDSYLRKKFTRDIMIVAVLLLFVLFILSLAGGFTISKLITNVAFPFLPAFIFCIKNVQDNTFSIEGLERRKSKADELWSKILQDPIK